MTMLIRAFSDYHVHVRDGQRLKDVVPYTTTHCGRFMVMPNLNPHITNASQMLAYREVIQREITHNSEVLMTISLTEETTPEMIKQAAEAGCTAVKLYPAGVTTNSQCGVSREILLSLIDHVREEISSLADRFWENLRAIEDSDLVLCIHGELPGEEVLDREGAMLPLIRAIFYSFKKIRIVLEHITTKVAVNVVDELNYTYPGRIAATITPHHLMYTLTDFLGDKLKPHLFCKPILKNDDDQVALLDAVVSCKKCFFLGSDSAPWHKSQKECAEGCAGVWNAPTLVSTMFEIFENMESLHLLEDFTSTFGDLFYHREHVDRYLEVEDVEWVVDDKIYGMVPFRAGQTMLWKVVNNG
jgi:dihydroorotase